MSSLTLYEVPQQSFKGIQNICQLLFLNFVMHSVSKQRITDK